MATPVEVKHMNTIRYLVTRTSVFTAVEIAKGFETAPAPQEATSAASV